MMSPFFLLFSILFCHIDAARSMSDIYTAQSHIQISFSEELRIVYPWLNSKNINTEDALIQIKYWFVHHLVHLASEQISLTELFFPHLICSDPVPSSIMLDPLYDFFVIFYTKNVNRVNFPKLKKSDHENRTIFNSLFTSLEVEKGTEKIKFLNCPEFVKWKEEIQLTLSNKTLHTDYLYEKFKKEISVVFIESLKQQYLTSINEGKNDAEIAKLYMIDTQANVIFSKRLTTTYPFLKFNKDSIKNASGELQQQYWFIRQLVYLVSQKISLYTLFPQFKDPSNKTDYRSRNIHFIAKQFLFFFIRLSVNNKIMSEIPYEKYTPLAKNCSDFLYQTGESDYVIAPNYWKIFEKLSCCIGEILDPEYTSKFLFICGDEFTMWRSELEQWLPSYHIGKQTLKIEPPHHFYFSKFIFISMGIVIIIIKIKICMKIIKKLSMNNKRTDLQPLI